MTSETSAELVAELARRNIKHTPEKIIRITRHPEGKIIFLEEGNSRAGFQHIVRAHGTDFVNKGIMISEIPDALMTAVTQNNVVGIQGRSRPVFLVEFKEKTYYIVIEISRNGFIVGANPKSGV